MAPGSTQGIAFPPSPLQPGGRATAQSWGQEEGAKRRTKKPGFYFFFPFPDSRSGLGLLHSNWSMGKCWGHGFRLSSVESCSTINNSPVPPSSPTLPQQPSVALFPSAIPIPFGILPYFPPRKGLKQEKIPPSTTAQEESPRNIGTNNTGGHQPKDWLCTVPRSRLGGQ